MTIKKVVLKKQDSCMVEKTLSLITNIYKRIMPINWWNHKKPGVIFYPPWNTLLSKVATLNIIEKCHLLLWKKRLLPLFEWCLMCFYVKGRCVVVILQSGALKRNEKKIATLLPFAKPCVALLDTALFPFFSVVRSVKKTWKVRHQSVAYREPCRKERTPVSLLPH